MIIIYNIFPSIFFFFFFFFSNHRLGYKFKVLKSKTILKKLLFINGYSASRMKVTLDWPISNYEKYSWEQISRLFTLQMYSLNSIYIYIYAIFVLPDISANRRKQKTDRKSCYLSCTEFYYYCIRIPIHDLQ